MGALTDHTSFANFSFLEFLLLFNFQDLFEKYKILFSGELNYLCNDNQENIIFEKPDDYQSVLNQYKDIWDKSYLANTNAEEIAIVIIKVAYSYRFNRDAGYGIEDIQKLLRKEIINQY
ncbi:Uncharacterised protein [[Flavobacterium] thermophilum]|nr:Uncharacterised protein [[Flavobacterium] thermophilum]STO36135.1 Uncharacterised protein [[Flavobacterium] thermophilum]